MPSDEEAIFTPAAIAAIRAIVRAMLPEIIQAVRDVGKMSPEALAEWRASLDAVARRIVLNAQIDGQHVTVRVLPDLAAVLESRPVKTSGHSDTGNT